MSAVLGAAALAALFFSVLLREDATLENSLVDMSLFPPVSRREVLTVAGTPLAGTLENRVLKAAESPYILSGAVRIPAGVTVRAEPGVAVYASESASLVVEGTFTAEKISLVSNQLHQAARLWSGIIAQHGGAVEVENTVIMDASAAFTCAEGGYLRVRGGTLQGNAAGVVTLPGSRTCSIDNVKVAEGRVGFHLVGGTPRLTNITLDRMVDGIRVFHEAAPVLRALAVKRPIHAAIVYAAHPDLVVHGLTLSKAAATEALVFDGNTSPTHRWRDQEYQTGKILVR